MSHGQRSSLRHNVRNGVGDSVIITRTSRCEPQKQMPNTNTSLLKCAGQSVITVESIIQLGVKSP